MSKGFHMLVSTDKPNPDSPPHKEVPSQIMMLPLSAILDDNTFQYRITTAVAALATDIKARGQTTPIFARLLDTRYQLISGFRRVAALRELGQEKVLARVFQELNDTQAVGLAISENLQREDFSDLEKAMVSQRLKDLGLEIEEIAIAINRSVRTVQQYIAVLHAPQLVKDALHEGKISLSMAFELARKNVDKSTLSDVIDKVTQEDLSVRALKQTLEDKNRITAKDSRHTQAGKEKRGRAGFQPIRLISRDSIGFDLVVKFRQSRPEDLAPIITALRTALKELEQKEADVAEKR